MDANLQDARTDQGPPQIHPSFTLRLGPVTLCLKDPQDILGVVETYVFDVYSTSLLREGDQIIDVGAGIGDFAVKASRIVGKNGRVLAIEPSPSDFAFLRDNVLRNKCKNVLLANEGVAERPRTISSTYKGRGLVFGAKTLESIAAEFDMTRPDVLKMDIEGLEAVVLEASPSLVSAARLIVVEFHGEAAVPPNVLSGQFSSIGLSRLQIWSRTAAFVARHPLLSLHIYTILRSAISREPMGRLARGPEITRGEILKIVRFSRR